MDGETTNAADPPMPPPRLRPLHSQANADEGYGTVHSPAVSSTMSSTMNGVRENLPKVSTNQVTVEMHHCLGSGTFGNVYRGVHDEYGDVAIKIAVDDRSKRKDLLKECSMLYKYGGHPNIVTWYGLYDTGTNLGFVMELMDCGSLDNLLLKERHLEYSIDHVLSWLSQAAAGVGYMHSIGLVHRDLKPLNLLLRDGYLHLKLCDFGTVIDIRRTMTNCIGSAPYMAPEVFRGSKYGPPCDVYSMGIIFWQMLTRRSPYGRVEKIALLWNVHEGHRPPVVRCHPILRQFMEKCWSAKPEDRPPMIKVFKFAEILSKAYPNGREPLKDTSMLSADPMKISHHLERLSTGRVGGHRRTRSDEVTLVNTSTPASTCNDMTASTPGPTSSSAVSTPTRAVNRSSQSSSATPFHHSMSPANDADQLLAKVPPHLRPPTQVLDDDSSEQSYNEHLAMCREWVDLNNLLAQSTARKHDALFEVQRQIDMQRRMQKLEHLRSVRENALQRIRVMEEGEEETLF